MMKIKMKIKEKVKKLKMDLIHKIKMINKMKMLHHNYEKLKNNNEDYYNLIFNNLKNINTLLRVLLTNIYYFFKITT